ncbi:uracil-DNA glycosylase [Halodesulfurarchaeum sp. HSR-GB]|uniref:uracil-DNA glycosylase n=1 Tax=Halodesulfurarchaeum sp. HSR-GB TaxID=3074077 RepID=UPI002862748C|nr:uracil-DNA glycosylase [Halodesulfurarchaeum sp. HSR-GB]MDR5657071.1 uracil-DNA glycosylase [Halodesulfurarchaeum sp. HSR-GB]
MKVITDRTRNPFGFSPPCEEFIPGSGDPNADFHLIGDRPSEPTATALLEDERFEPLRAVLEAVGLLNGGAPGGLYTSYLYPCYQNGEPTPATREAAEALFDAELRAITAHVLLPVGEAAIEYALRNYSSIAPGEQSAAIHGTEITNGSWIIVPIRDPTVWEPGDAETLEATLQSLRSFDYRRESDLGRHVTGPGSYRVR